MSFKFINIIHDNSLAIAGRWAEVVSGSFYTRTYAKLSKKELVEIARSVYENLGRWLDPETSPEEVGRIYGDLGAKRYEEGYPLCEILYVIHYHKEVMLNYIFSEGLLPDTLTLYRVTEFIVKINDFFDLAGFYVTRGFQESLYRKLISQKGIGKENIQDIFPVGSFYFEREPDFRSFEKALEGFNLFKVK